METERLIDRLTVSPREAATLMGVSHQTVYSLLHRDNGIPSFKLGQRTLVPLDGLRAWIAAQTGGADCGG